VSFSGATNLDGITDWVANDWAIFNGSVWQKIDQTDIVVSVNALTGAVVLTQDTVADGATYARVKGTELSVGQVAQLRAVSATANVTGDQIKTLLDEGKILWSSWAGGFHIPAINGAAGEVAAGVNLLEQNVHRFSNAVENILHFEFVIPPWYAGSRTLYINTWGQQALTESKNLKLRWRFFATKSDGTELNDKAAVADVNIDNQAMPGTAGQTKMYQYSATLTALSLEANDKVRVVMSSPAATTNSRADHWFLTNLLVYIL
jgi:hypothetical protein